MLFASVAMTVSEIIGTIWTGSRRKQRSPSLQVDRSRATATSQGARAASGLVTAAARPSCRRVCWRRNRAILFNRVMCHRYST